MLPQLKAKFLEPPNEARDLNIQTPEWLAMMPIPLYSASKLHQKCKNKNLTKTIRKHHSCEEKNEKYVTC